MSDSLSNRVKTRPIEDPELQAFLNLLVASGHIRQRMNEVCAEFGITHDQYNVLRILKGVHPEGHPRYEIQDRLLERAPDVTRLVDRLEREGLVERYRSQEDRRLSISRITEAGLALLERMDGPLGEVRRRFMGRVSEADHRALSRICAALYQEE